MENLEWRLSELEHSYGEKVNDNEKKIRALDATILRLMEDNENLSRELKQVKQAKEKQGGSGADMFTRRVEWTITDLKKKLETTPKGESLWSPEFSAAGISGMQLEFLPKGRETTVHPGFCSLFLWCPSGTKIRYQLWVGNHLRAPDEDEYDGRMGHGHSNFCNLEAECVGDSDSVRVGVDILEATTTAGLSNGLKSVRTSLMDIVKQELEVYTNKEKTRVEWRIQDIKKRLQSLPRGASLYSPLFSLAGVKNILLEFYPNGSQNTKKDGFCAYYLRGPEGVTVTVTMFVGNYKKGPIQTSFDGATGKGLPEFCEVDKEIDEATNSLLVGVDLRCPEKGKPKTTLQIES